MFLAIVNAQDADFDIISFDERDTNETSTTGMTTTTGGGTPGTKISKFDNLLIHSLRYSFNI
jgi:hypothetical protein